MGRAFRIVSDIGLIGAVGVNAPFEIGYSVKNEGDVTADHRHHLQIWREGEQQAVAERYVHIPSMEPYGYSHYTQAQFQEGLDEGRYTVFISVDCDSPGESYQYQESFDIPRL